MEEKSYCIYMHVNKINNKKYIGMTCQKPERRWSQGEGYRSNLYFYNAIQKYTWDGFEHVILKDNLSYEDACITECNMISFYQSNNAVYGYNFEGGGKVNKEISEDTRLKLSIAMLGKNNPMYGKHRSEETKLKIHNSLVGKPLSSECRIKISDGLKEYYSCHAPHPQTKESREKIGMAHKGKALSEEHKAHISESLTGRKQSAETCKKISESTSGVNHHHYNKQLSEEHKKKLKASAHRGSENHNSRAVLCVETNEIFPCISEAAKCVNTSHTNISLCCRGKSKTAKGYHWKYV